MITRRYHGLLIAALPAPLGRIVMLSHVGRAGAASPTAAGSRSAGANDPAMRPTPHGTRYLTEFRLEAGLPVWRYDIDGIVIEKRVFLPHMQNTVHMMYELLDGADQRRAGASAVGEFPRAGSRRSASRSAGRTSSAPSGDYCEIALPGQRRFRRCACSLFGDRCDVHAEGHADRQRAVSGGGEPRLPGAAAICGAPATSASR